MNAWSLAAVSVAPVRTQVAKDASPTARQRVCLVMGVIGGEDVGSDTSLAGCARIPVGQCAPRALPHYQTSSAEH